MGVCYQDPLHRNNYRPLSRLLLCSEWLFPNRWLPGVSMLLHLNRIFVRHAALLLTLLAISVMQLLLSSQIFQSRTQSSGGFWLRRETVMKNVSASRTTTETTEIALRTSDGARLVDHVTEGQRLVTIAFPALKQQVNVDPARRQKSTTTVKWNRGLDIFLNRVPTSGSCSEYSGANDKFIGKEVFGKFGLPALRYGVEYDPQLARYKTILVVVPDLNCFVVFNDTVWKGPDGSVSSQTVHQVTDIVFGEPKAAYFEVDSSFAEVLPSKLFGDFLAAAAPAAPIARAFQLPACLRDRLAKMDGRYQAGRTKPEQGSLVAAVSGR